MILLVLFGVVLVLLYIVNQVLFTKWSRQGIPQGEPKTLFGDFKDVFLHTKSIADVSKSIYEASKQHKVFGVYLSYRPMLFINDPKLIRNIMLKDFAFFPDRGVHSDGSFDPLSEQLFFQGGETWRRLRAKLTPAFTSGKLKAMLPIVSKNGKILQDYIKENLNEGKHLFELRDLVARLNTNIITNVAYGIEVDTINDPKHIMRQMGVKVFEPNTVAGLRFFTAFFTPLVNRLFKFKFVNDETENFFKKIIGENVEYREQNDYHRNDLMQTLIQLKNDGFTTGDKADCDRKKITRDDVFAQSFGFYLGGFETTSTTVSYCLHELAKNQKLQRKAQEEVDAMFKMTEDGEEMYDMLKSMKFIECCIFETLRKYTPLPVLNRKCVSDYKVVDSDMVIRSGTPVIIPIFALQRDADIYPQPLEFRPERFENNPSGSDADGMYYLPFGEGQRICIGHRMGKQNAKFQLALLISEFNFELSSFGTIEEIKFNPNQLFLQPIGDINLKLSLR